MQAPAITGATSLTLQCASSPLPAHRPFDVQCRLVTRSPGAQVIPRSERASENNHGNYYDVQLMCVLKYLERCAPQLLDDQVIVWPLSDNHCVLLCVLISSQGVQLVRVLFHMRLWLCSRTLHALVSAGLLSPQRSSRASSMSRTLLRQARSGQSFLLCTCCICCHDTHHMLTRSGHIACSCALQAPQITSDCCRVLLCGPIKSL